jgi:hypothetical protein
MSRYAAASGGLGFPPLRVPIIDDDGAILDVGVQLVQQSRTARVGAEIALLTHVVPNARANACRLVPNSRLTAERKIRTWSRHLPPNATMARFIGGRNGLLAL